jgi:hypothetical protein
MHPKYIYFYFTFILFSAAFISKTVFAGDNSKYLAYAVNIKGFDTTGYSISTASDGEVNVKNASGSILRFRVNEKDELRAYHCGIVYILYEFSQGWIKSYRTFDKNAELKGDDEFDDLAVVEYDIRKMDLLHAKFEVLDAADGNIEMDDSEDEIVYTKVYNSKNKLIRKNYISSKEYWNANNVMYRP